MFNKKIGIFGLGISGTSSFNFLKESAKKIICWDDSESNRKIFDQQFLVPISDKNWQELDMIVISPGIAKSHPIFVLAKNYNIQVSSDIEIFLKVNHSSKIIAITGTNGKSTVTSMIGHILTQEGLNYHIGGNIGMPVLSLLQHAKGYVIELSSFQLDLLNTINPTIAILLNITPDHLDRHGTYDEYCKIKEKIFMGDGLKIIGTDSPCSNEIYQKLSNSGEKKLIAINQPNGISCNSSNIVDNFFDIKSYILPKLNHLPGKHNCENIAASFSVCRAVGLKGENIIKHIKSFKGLKHRIEFVKSYNNISFYNDSKATNASSAAASLSAFNNIFWLAGGVFKEENLLAIEKYTKNIKKAYLYGKSRLLFAKHLENKVDYAIYQTMEEAFNMAVSEARLETGKANILLAPACASFDQFKNFEDRGNFFINLCNAQF